MKTPQQRFKVSTMKKNSTGKQQTDSRVMELLYSCRATVRLDDTYVHCAIEEIDGKKKGFGGKEDQGR